MLGRLVKVGDRRCQWGHELDTKGADRCQSIQQCLLREPIHLHQPIDRPAVSSECIRTVVLASDGDDSTIERRRRPPVEANFGLTQCAAALGGRKVEIVEPHGPLQLVRPRTREKDNGCVRVNTLNRGAAMGKWRSKEVDDGRLVFGDHGGQGASAPSRMCHSTHSAWATRCSDNPSSAMIPERRRMQHLGAIGVPECTGRQRAPPSNRRPTGCGLFRSRREDYAGGSSSQAASVTAGAGILLFTAMVRSVLLHVQGHETRSHADLTDRDRDESSRRAISAWVRTNPQTQVR